MWSYQMANCLQIGQKKHDLHVYESAVINE